jgi:hypothetical protein
MVLQIIQDLMTKAQDIFLDHFARLGVFSKVLQLAGPQDIQESQSNNKDENVSQHGFKKCVIRYTVNSWASGKEGRGLSNIQNIRYLKVVSVF